MLVDYRLNPSEIDTEEAHRLAILNQLDIHPTTQIFFKIIRRNIDARGKQVVYVLRAEVSTEHLVKDVNYSFHYQDVSDKPEVHIIGAGPCGYFAALQLIELGLKPIVIERGKDVRQRRKDFRDIQ